MRRPEQSRQRWRKTALQLVVRRAGVHAVARRVGALLTADGDSNQSSEPAIANGCGSGIVMHGQEARACWCPAVRQ